MPPSGTRRRRRPTTPRTTSRCGCPTPPAPRPTWPEYRGQTLDARPGRPEELHRGCTSSARRPTASGGGNYTLTYDDGVDADASPSSSRTGAARVTAPAHIAIGPLQRPLHADRAPTARAARSTTSRVDNPQPTRKLVSVTLPPAHGRGGNARGYLMALTLEEAERRVRDARPHRRQPVPERQHRAGRPPCSDRAASPTASGWYTTAPRITLTGTRRDRRLRRRADPVPDQRRRRRSSTPARSTSPPRARSCSSSARSTAPATPRGSTASTLKVDADGAHDRRPRPPGAPAESGWHDTEVTVGLRAARRPGSGTRTTEYRVNPADDDAAWTAVRRAPFKVGGSGTQRRRVPLDTTWPATSRPTKALDVRVDVTAPTTTLRDQRRRAGRGLHRGRCGWRSRAPTARTARARSRPSTASTAASGRPTRARSTSPRVAGLPGRLPLDSISPATSRASSACGSTVRRAGGAAAAPAPQAPSDAGAEAVRGAARRSPRGCGRCPRCAAGASRST